MIHGIDVSHHQGLLNWSALARDGVAFAFIKSTEGSTFQDDRFTANLTGATNAGMLVAAYHYVRSSATAAAQVANVVRTVPRTIPVIPDIEANSGGIALAQEFVALLGKAGYHVPLTYLPRWYWAQIGSPSLKGLPPLWSSRYPDNVPGSIADEYADVPLSYWAGYGGSTVTVLQYTSSAIIAGKSPLDANAFQGTRAQLAQILNQEDDDMAWNDTWTFTPAGMTTPITVTFADMVGNMYAMKFYGSDTEPWKGASEVAMLKDLVARQIADLDETELADELAKRGIGGATPAQVKEAFQEVLRKAGAPDVPDAT